MNEQTEAAETADSPTTVEVPLKGRMIHMAVPSPEQILVWKRTIRRFEGITAEGMNAAQAVDAIDRCVSIITALMPLRQDVDWMEDGLLERRLTLNDLLELFKDTVEKYASLAHEAKASGNREDRRAADKAAKKVTRKKAAKSTGKDAR